MQSGELPAAFANLSGWQRDHCVLVHPTVLSLLNAQFGSIVYECGTNSVAVVYPDALVEQGTVSVPDCNVHATALCNAQVIALVHLTVNNVDTIHQVHLQYQPARSGHVQVIGSA